MNSFNAEQGWLSDSKSPDQFNYGEYTVSKLKKEFFTLVSIEGNTSNNEVSSRLTALKREFQRRGIELPLEKKSNKWWQFWK